MLNREADPRRTDLLTMVLLPTLDRTKCGRRRPLPAVLRPHQPQLLRSACSQTPAEIALRDSTPPGVGADGAAPRRRRVSPPLSRTEPRIVLISIVLVPGHAGGSLQGRLSPVPVVLAAIELLYSTALVV